MTTIPKRNYKIIYSQEANPQITINHYKFTGDEHDNESNLEHAQFRQLSSVQGRWLSPDPLGIAAADLTNPQSLNLYTYVLNNPLNSVDPSGLCQADDNGGQPCPEPPPPPSWAWLAYQGAPGWASTQSFFCMLLGSCAPPQQQGAGGSGGAAQKPTLDCSKPPQQPAAPPNVNVNANIEQGQQVAQNATATSLNATPGSTGPGTGGASGSASITINSWLYSQFHTWGPQDYKHQYGDQYMNFGNFNFGAVCGATGFSLINCQSAAGIGLIGRVAIKNTLYTLGAGPHYQYNGSGIPYLSAPYGDQASDSAQIAAGYYYQQWVQACQKPK